MNLTRRLVEKLQALRHHNGSQVAIIYGNHDAEDEAQQGPIVAFSLRRSNGDFIGYAEVDKLACLNNFQIRV
jgi:molybdenum cofactor sulfurtransferase